MEFVIELVAEILLDSIVEVATTPSISKWVRYPMLILVITLYTILLGLFALMTLSQISQREYLAALILGICFIAIFILFYLFIKELIKKSKKLNEEDINVED